MKNTPWMAVGNDELNDKPVVKAGDKVICPRCGELHTLRPGQRLVPGPSGTYEDATKVRDDFLMAFSCGETVYLGALRGRLITGRLPS